MSDAVLQLGAELILDALKDQGLIEDYIIAYRGRVSVLVVETGIHPTTGESCEMEYTSHCGPLDAAVDVLVDRMRGREL